ncbi:MAG: hypothetical protein U9Q66_04615 [Patescibacteria group bacterium]|nr:hypothetical protein [Patescibacteria group bacterium]
MENFEAEFLTNDDAFNAAFDLSNDTNDEIAALKLKNPSERPN